MGHIWRMYCIFSEENSYLCSLTWASVDLTRPLILYNSPRLMLSHTRICCSTLVC